MKNGNLMMSLIALLINNIDNNHNDIFILDNKRPVYDPKRGEYSLDFNGRACKLSIKNF